MPKGVFWHRGWMEEVQMTATRGAETEANSFSFHGQLHSPFISVILLFDTVTFIAGSVREFVPVAYMHINLIYLNDFNESCVFLRNSYVV